MQLTSVLQLHNRPTLRPPVLPHSRDILDSTRIHSEDDPWCVHTQTRHWWRHDDVFILCVLFQEWTSLWRSFCSWGFLLSRLLLLIPRSLCLVCVRYISPSISHLPCYLPHLFTRPKLTEHVFQEQRVRLQVSTSVWTWFSSQRHHLCQLPSSTSTTELTRGTVFRPSSKRFKNTLKRK